MAGFCCGKMYLNQAYFEAIKRFHLPDPRPVAIGEMDMKPASDTITRSGENAAAIYTTFISHGGEHIRKKIDGIWGIGDD